MSKIDLNEDEAKNCLEEHLEISHKIGYEVGKGEQKPKSRQRIYLSNLFQAIQQQI